MAIVGYALLGAVAAIVLLLCIPAGVSVRYRTGDPPEAWLRWLWMKLDLTELSPPKEKEQPKAEKSKQTQKAPAKKQPSQFTEQLGVAIDLLSSLGGGAGLVVRRFRIYLLRLHFVVAEDDAAQTAIAYGRVNAAVYTVYAAAGRLFNLAPPDIEIRPDFTTEEGSVDFELRGRLMPIVAVAAGIHIGCAFLIKVLKRKNADKDSEQPHKATK